MRAMTQRLRADTDQTVRAISSEKSELANEVDRLKGKCCETRCLGA
jgi:hypothetical protein